MNNKIEDKLSALVDSELSGEETSQAISQLRTSRELLDTWDRYHLIGDAIRGEGHRFTVEGVARQISDRLESEPAMLVRPTPVSSPKPVDRLSKPLVGAALAASIAAVAVITLPRWSSEIPGQPPGQIVSAPPAPITYASQTGTRWKNLAEPALESKLNRFLESHSEHASSGGMGVMPYSSFVSYDASNGRP